MIKPTVSIVIPCYQQGSYLRQAIESVLGQTLANVETIVVNDGSTDNTDEIASEFADRIRCIRQSNRGLMAARNRAIREAAGEYILFLDADDMLHPQALEHQYSAMESQRNRLCIMEHRDFETVPELHGDGVKGSPTLEPTLPYIIHKCPGPPVKIMAPLEAVKKIRGFTLSSPGCADWDLWLRLALHGVDQMIMLPFEGAYYRRYPGSMSTDITKMLHSRSDVLHGLHYQIVSDGSLFRLWGQELANAEQRVLRRYIANGIYDQYYELLRQLVVDLRRRGIRPTCSKWKVLADSALGIHSETLAMQFHRLFSREYLNYYRMDIR